MANKDLIGRTWKIPPKYIKNLQQQLSNYKGDKHVEGYTRLKNLVNSQKISYENLKNVKHILEKYQNSNETLYNLNGGQHFHRWINDQLKVARDRIEGVKKSKANSGQSNAYIKTHEKKSPDNTKTRMPKYHKSTSSNDIFNGNVNYENKKISKVVITECQLKKMLKEDEDEFDYKSRIMNLISSGQEENIEMAFEMSEGLGLPIKDWIGEFYGKPIGWLISYNVFESFRLKDILVELFGKTHLNLSYKHIDKIPSDVFKPLKHLKSIDLSNNSIEELNENTFKYNTELVDISLNSNKIKNIHRDTFASNVKLENLTLFTNNIEILDVDVFRYNVNLHVLSLGENQIKYINPKMFEHNVKLEYLKLYDNQLSSKNQQEISESLPQTRIRF